MSIVSGSIQVPGPSVEGRRGFCLRAQCCLSLVSLTWTPESVVLLFMCFNAECGSCEKMIQVHPIGALLPSWLLYC